MSSQIFCKFFTTLTVISLIIGFLFWVGVFAY